MARDPLDASLPSLCTDAERNVILVRRWVAAHPHLRRLGVEPEALALELAQAAEAGRAAHTARFLAHLAVDEAASATSAAAEAAYELQQAARDLGATLLRLDRQRWGAPVEELRALLRLKAPRVRSGLDQLRHLRDHLARPEHPLLEHPGGLALRDRVVALEAEHTRAIARKAAAVRDRRVRVSAAVEARRTVQEALRKGRTAWLGARRRDPTLPAFTLESSARAVARGAVGDDDLTPPSDVAGAEADGAGSDPGAPGPVEPGDGSADDRASTSDPEVHDDLDVSAPCPTFAEG